MKSFWISVDEDLLDTEFTDLSGTSWAIKYVEKAKEYWIKWELVWWMKIFRPNDKITRAESLAIIFKLLKIDSSNITNNSFSDIDTEWIIPYANNAKRLWIVSWQLKNWKLIFRPSDSLTRAEASRMIIKSYKLWQ